MERKVRKFIIEVEEGRTMCHKCPFSATDCTEEIYSVLDCGNYNLATIKIKEYEDNTRDTSAPNRD